MRAQEFITENKNILYHGSVKEFPIGFILEAQSDGYTRLNDKDISITEKILESSRPQNSISRYDSVFMVDNPDDIDNMGGYIDYIYIVEPIGKLERNDIKWYTEISIYGPYNDDMDDEINQWSMNYWNGIQHPKGIWEYRALKAKIVKILEINI